jgi:hypothetical protein
MGAWSTRRTGFPAEPSSDRRILEHSRGVGERGAVTARDCAGGDLVWVDEQYDRQFTSDGVSRYAAYLRARGHLFADEDGPVDQAGFAVLAWRTATSPVTSAHRRTGPAGRRCGGPTALAVGAAPGRGTGRVARLAGGEGLE